MSKRDTEMNSPKPASQRGSSWHPLTAAAYDNKRITLLTGCLLLALSLLPAQSVERVALVIGVNQYDMMSDLKASVNDAELMAAYYKGLDFKVWTLDDRQNTRMNQPSLGNMRRMMGNITETMKGLVVDEVVVFFAGHGVQVEGNSYLCFPEAQLQSREGMLDVTRDLLPWARELRPRLTMIYLDACRNELGPIRAGGFDSGLLPRGLNVAGAREQSLAILYGARPGTFSYEKPDGSNGFFTEVLLEALQSDTTRSVQDLFNYLRAVLPKRTETAYGQVQIPHLGGDLDLYASFSKGKLDLARNLNAGQLYVQVAGNQNATILINGQPRGEAPILLEAVPPGLVTVEASNRTMYGSSQVTVTAKAYQSLTISMTPMKGDLFLEGALEHGTGNTITYPAFVRGLALAIDGKEERTIETPLVDGLVPGTWNLALYKDGWYWEDVVTIKPREVVRIKPVFEPVGTVRLRVPVHSRAILSNTAGIRLLVEQGEEQLNALPVGTWRLEIDGPGWEAFTQDFELSQGQALILEPKPLRRPEYQRGDELLSLRQARQVLEEEVEALRRANTLPRRTGLISAGLGAAAAGFGAWFLYDANQQYQLYQNAADQTAAGAAREAAVQSYRLGLGLTISGGTGLAAFIGSLFFQKPLSPLRRRLTEIDTRILALSGQELAFDE